MYGSWKTGGGFKRWRMPEAIINRVNGYLVPPYDYNETAYRIMDSLNDSEKAGKMGLASRKMIEERLNMQSSVLKLLKVYEESIRSCNKRGLEDLP